MRARRFIRRSEPAEGDPPSREAAERQAFAAAVRALARRPRTRAEIESLLERRGFDHDVTESVIVRLRDHGYLDEKAVADAVVREASRRRLGSRRVAQQLARRGVPREVSRAAIDASSAGELERARELVARLDTGDLGGHPRKSAKAIRFLLSRGYSVDVARRAVGLDIDVDGDFDEGEDA